MLWVTDIYSYSALAIRIPNIRNLYAISLNINEIMPASCTIIFGRLRGELMALFCDIYSVINHCRLSLRLVI